MNEIVTTVLGNDGKAPNAILWMPEGEHFIQASVNGKPGFRRVPSSPSMEYAHRSLYCDALSREALKSLPG